MDENYDAITFISENLFFILRGPRVANFGDISKLPPSLLRQPIKTPWKLKELEIKY